MESLEGSTIQPIPLREGTLAIDLGNSTTVVAFQGELEETLTLLDLPPITRRAGEIPSLIRHSTTIPNQILIGNEVSTTLLKENDHENIISDFKRWIGAPKSSRIETSSLTAEEAGEILIEKIWENIPKEFKIKRLVLTAPVETYRAYRKWLLNICTSLQVNEISLVDEPTAAAMGAGLPSGSALLVVDIGGSTIDMSIVELEGGEGKAEPIAQLLRFNGENLEGKSNQALRCAKVLGKAGQRLGGRDIDRWIANYLYPERPLSESLLNTAEKLKCRLSEQGLKETKLLSELIPSEFNEETQSLSLCKLDFEKLLIEKGLLKTLDNLFEQTFASGKRNGCNLEDLENVVIVGGGARIPLIQKWLQQQSQPIKMLTPPPIEAIAIGALKLTPGVKVRDVLHKNVSLRCWDQKNQIYKWHPLFMAGQTWPTSKPLEIVLATSSINQKEIELQIGEPEISNAHEIIYTNGIPTILPTKINPRIIQWDGSSTVVILDQPGQPGEDCLKLKFNINNDCQLELQGIDLRSKREIQETTTRICKRV